MIQYIISRARKNNAVKVRKKDTRTGKIVDLTPYRSQEVWNHSLDGFEFGYVGSGPSQLALAILLDHIGLSIMAVKHHNQFLWDFIGTMDNAGGTITSEQIQEWLLKQENGVPVETEEPS